jgi:hypothetical protein
VRIVRGNHLRTVWHHVRLFVMIALTAAVSLSLHKTVVHTAAAEPEQKPVTEEQVTPTVQLQPALLQADTPQSTTPIDTKPADTILRWTPTGTGDVQDAYNVRVAMDSTIDPLSHELTTNVQKNPNGLTAAELDATDLPEGTYFWQVQSCSTTVPATCNAWSEVWTLQVDATPPLEPTARFTSEMYSQTVSFAGTAEAATAVSVIVGDKTCTTTALEDGTWSCTFAGTFDYGDYTASIKAADKAGNESPSVMQDFSVKELFVAPVIAPEELPPVLNIVPVDETPKNTVLQQKDAATIDVVNPTNDKTILVEAPVKPLSTDGGIVQSSKNGWQVFGLPWFMWAGGGAGLAGAWWAFGVPLPRRLTSIVSL